MAPNDLEREVDIYFYKRFIVHTLQRKEIPGNLSNMMSVSTFH